MRLIPKLALPLFLVAALGAAPLHAANVNVSRLELLTQGGYDNASGRFSLGSRLYFGMALEGGSKFAGNLLMDFRSGNIEEDLAEWAKPLDGSASPAELAARLNAAASPRLRSASVTARELFGLPFDLTYFVGSLGNFCSGDDFVPLFGAAPFASELRGPMHYPDGIKTDRNRFYDGIHAVYGTGLRANSTRMERSVLYLYVYQDSDLGASGQWSADLRGLWDLGQVKLEAFAGGSLDSSAAYGLYRGGLLFHFAPGNVGEFYAQIGVPRWNPAEALSADALYFLFEPRITFAETGSLALTVFLHPGWYRQTATGEDGAIDIGFNLRLGALSSIGAQGGLSSLIAFRPEGDDDEYLNIDLSPYFSVISGGVQWDLKLGLRLWPFPTPWYGIFKPYLGVKTSF